MATSDGNGDQRGDLWIGSPGSAVGNQAEAGVIELWSGLGTFIRRIQEPVPQNLAGFGTSLAAPGSLDGGVGKDVVAGAPFREDLRACGSRTGAGLRRSDGRLAVGPDRFPGLGRVSAPHFRRASTTTETGSLTSSSARRVPLRTVAAARGAAYVLSGTNGKVLASLAGRRGRETRLFIAGPDLDRRSVIRSFDPFGHRREADIRAFRDRPVKALSMAILDPAGRTNASKTLLAVGAGKGGGTPGIAVYRAGRRRLRVSTSGVQFPFPAGPGRLHRWTQRCRRKLCFPER